MPNTNPCHNGILSSVQSHLVFSRHVKFAVCHQLLNGTKKNKKPRAVLSWLSEGLPAWISIMVDVTSREENDRGWAWMILVAVTIINVSVFFSFPPRHQWSNFHEWCIKIGALHSAFISEIQLDTYHKNCFDNSSSESWLSCTGSWISRLSLLEEQWGHQYVPRKKILSRICSRSTLELIKTLAVVWFL